MKLEYVLQNKGDECRDHPSRRDCRGHWSPRWPSSASAPWSSPRMGVPSRASCRSATSCGTWPTPVPRPGPHPVSTIMTPTVTCAPPSATTGDLMGLMTESRIRHVPVLDDDEHMVGIVSIGDVVKSRLGELEDERDALVEYVTVGR